jgi:Tfp pilus assembly protein PilN
MKIKLNLLPKSKEKRLKNKKILKFLVLQEIMIIFITFLFFGIIHGINAVAKFQLNTVEQQLSLSATDEEYLKIKKYEDGLREATVKVDFIRKIQKFKIDWTVVLNKLATIMPQEMTVVSITSDGYGFLLKGVAQNRDALIMVKEKMQQDECFENINIPINNIVLREDIDFELNFYVKQNCLNIYEKK